MRGDPGGRGEQSADVAGRARRIQVHGPTCDEDAERGQKSGGGGVSIGVHDGDSVFTLRQLRLTRVNHGARPRASGTSPAANRSSAVGRNRPSAHPFAMLYPARRQAPRRLLAPATVRKYGRSGEDGPARPFARAFKGLCVSPSAPGAARGSLKRKREMDKRAKFHGSMPALVTPFKDGKFDETGVPRPGRLADFVRARTGWCRSARRAKARR